MDTTDPNIAFDDFGVCNHCREAKSILLTEPFCLSAEKKEHRLTKLVDKIKQTGKQGKYDCIIGVSGGVDSSFVAYKVKELGLRPLAVHFDNGWNSELAQKNIENILRRLDIDLYTYVVDWPEFRDLQLSFLKASTPDSEIPSDHAIVTLLYNMARKHGVKYILAGTNLSTESILPKAWSQGHRDWKYIKSVQKQFGKMKLKSFPHTSLWRNFINQRVLNIQFVSLLDYMDYVKEDAMKTLEDKVEWRQYGGKHHESIYTKFFQSYILPTKFNFDKRRAHLSSLICVGQITREDALLQLMQPQYNDTELREDKEYVLSKFNLSADEFTDIMSRSPKSYFDYSSYLNSWYYKFLRSIYRSIFVRQVSLG